MENESKKKENVGDENENEKKRNKFRQSFCIFADIFSIPLDPLALQIHI